MNNITKNPQDLEKDLSLYFSLEDEAAEAMNGGQMYPQQMFKHTSGDPDRTITPIFDSQLVVRG